VWRLILRGELFRAPIPKSVQRVLDVGTGTGIWAMEFADEFPGAIVVANDLSPIQPRWVPPNVQFEIDNVEDVWPFSQPLDYIHIRNMGAAIADWPRLCAQAMQHLKPGGWIEIQEHAIEMHSEDGVVPPNLADWLEKMEGAARSFGKEMNIAKKVKGFLQSAGFKDVQEDIYKVKNNPGAKYEPKLIATDPSRGLGKG
jgi:trans-aconitate methyltransferase